MSTSDNQLLAAIDLGSNSFHMIVAKFQNGQLQIIDRMKEMVRLAAGLDKQGNLTPEAQERALDCLRKFGQRLRGVEKANIRIVGTNTLRKAKNSAEFIAKAEEAVAQTIEAIAGREEARLIYLGVSHSQASTDESRLVIDIGGGSTEYIIGKRFAPQLMESLHMGCVSMTQFAFADGQINEANFQRALLQAGLELQGIREEYQQHGWTLATGASGTIKAIGKVLSAHEGDANFTAITLDNLLWLKSAMIEQGSIDALDLPGLQENRVPVFVGGVAVLLASFIELGISAMNVSDYALREGLIYDIYGRSHNEDVRERTVQHMMKQYHVDPQQAQRVSQTAEVLYQQAAHDWKIADHASQVKLHWACQLHEIGLSIAHNQYQKHAAYIALNADMPGFSTPEQQRLSLLLRAQRRKVPKSELKALPDNQRQRVTYLMVILRLATLLHRSRSSDLLPLLSLKSGSKKLAITFPDGYLTDHPLTQADLAQEQSLLSAVGFELNFS